MKKFLGLLLLDIIIAMPFWIVAVSIRPWKQLTKMVLISVMVLISIGFSLYVLLRPHASTSVLTVWGGHIAIALYIVVVLISAFFAWRHP